MEALATGPRTQISFPFSDWPYDRGSVRAGLMSIGAFRDTVSPEVVNISRRFLSYLRTHGLLSGVDAAALTSKGWQLLAELRA